MDDLLDILVKPFRLKFDLLEEERAFQAEQNKLILRFLRVSLSSVLMLSIGYYFFGYAADAMAGLIVKFIVPGTFLALLASFTPGDGRHSQLIVGTISVVAQILIFIFIVRSSIRAGVPITYSFIVPCVLFQFIALNLQFVTSLLFGAIHVLGIVFATIIYDSAALTHVSFVSLVCFILGAVASQRLEVMQRSNFRSIRDIDRERRKTRSLIERVIPAPIFDRVLAARKKNDMEIHQEISDCSILFIKITGDLGSTRHQIFSMFDKVLGRSEVEKIKTMENTYIAAAGIFKRSRHAEEILNLAIRFRQEMVQFNLQNAQNIQFKAGIARGAVSSGVIGQRVFAFDVWGSPVNLASRIVDVAEWGSICLDGAFHHDLPGGYVSRSAGMFDLKGIGTHEIFEWISFSFRERFKEQEAA